MKPDPEIDPSSSAREPISEDLGHDPRRLALLQALAARFPLIPALVPIILEDDLTAPLDENDWPAELRP